MSRRLERLLFGAFVTASLYFFMPALHAATPKNTLVMANQIDDMITLDPAEVFEFTAAEYAANVYDRLVTYPPDNVEDLRGNVAESWTISDDGKTYTFKIRDGITFHSGNPLTAEDAAWSLQRVVKLNQTPSFILTQFGFTADNVDDKIKTVDDQHFTVEVDQPYAPTFFLYCLTATVGSVVDKKLVMAHEKDGDMGHEWLRPPRPARGRSSSVLEAEREPDHREEPELLGGRGRLRPGDHPAHPRAREPDAAPAEGRHRHRAQPRGRSDGSAQGQSRRGGQGGAQGRDLLSRAEPEEPVSVQARGDQGAQVSDTLPGDCRHHRQGLGGRAPDVPAVRIPRRARREPL